MLTLRQLFGVAWRDVFVISSLRRSIHLIPRRDVSAQVSSQRVSHKTSKKFYGENNAQVRSFDSQRLALPQMRATNIDLDSASLLIKVKKISEIVETSAKAIHRNKPLTSPHEVIGSRHDVIELLIKTRVPDDQIIKLLPYATIALATAPLRDWEESIEFLKGYLFHPTQILPILSTSPDLMGVNGGDVRKSLLDVLTWLRSRGLGEGKMQAVVAKHPAVLTCSLTFMQRNYASLLQVFIKSEVCSLIMANPIVLTTPWDETQEKLEYIFDTMGVSTKEILKSQLFKRSLSHITKRHEFLEHIGLYKKPHRRQVFPSENPTLTNIIDSSDKAFVTIVAKSNEVDYASFVEARKLEMVADDDSDTSDSEDIDIDVDTDSDDEKK